MAKRFSAEKIAFFQSTKYLYIRSGEHRFIPVWVVVVDGHVIVRSWNDKVAGWYRAFLMEPRGHVKLEDREVKIRAVPVRTEKLIDSSTEAYGEKYTTKANAKYVKGFATEKRKAATLELVPG